MEYRIKTIVILLGIVLSIVIGAVLLSWGIAVQQTGYHRTLIGGFTVAQAEPGLNFWLVLGIALIAFEPAWLIFELRKNLRAATVASVPNPKTRDELLMWGGGAVAAICGLVLFASAIGGPFSLWTPQGPREHIALIAAIIGCAGGAALFTGYFPTAVANTPVRSVNDSIAATGGYAGLCLAGAAILTLRYLYVLVRMLWH